MSHVVYACCCCTYSVACVLDVSLCSSSSSHVAHGSRTFVVVPAPKDNAPRTIEEDVAFDGARTESLSQAQEMIPFSACSFGRMQAMRSSCQSSIHAGAVARGAKAEEKR